MEQLKPFMWLLKIQLADAFTKALGVDNYLRLIKKLGLINIFAASVEFPKPVSETQTARALLLRGVLKLIQLDRKSVV